MKLRRGVVLTEVNGQAVVTGVGRRASYYRLNSVAAASLQLLIEGHSVTSAAEEIATRCGVEPARVEADIETLLDKLQAEGLVKKR